MAFQLSHGWFLMTRRCLPGSLFWWAPVKSTFTNGTISKRKKQQNTPKTIIASFSGTKNRSFNMSPIVCSKNLSVLHCFTNQDSRKQGQLSEKSLFTIPFFVDIFLQEGKKFHWHLAGKPWRCKSSTGMMGL